MVNCHQIWWFIHVLVPRYTNLLSILIEKLGWAKNVLPWNMDYKQTKWPYELWEIDLRHLESHLQVTPLLIGYQKPKITSIGGYSISDKTVVQSPSWFSFLCAAALSVRRPHLKADLTWEADAWWLGCGRLMMASSGLIYFALRRYFSSGDRQPSVVLLGHICCSGRWWVGGSGKPRLTSTVRS